MPLVEWVAGMISAAIVLGTLGYLGFEAFQPGPDEPRLTVTVLRTRESAGTFVVELEIRNNGRGAAAGVQIAGLARRTASGERRGQAVVDHVPGLSTRQASLVFDDDPGADLDVRVVGYAKP
jgi:uncharacterized protein (TIGR02588 family)